MTSDPDMAHLILEKDGSRVAYAIVRGVRNPPVLELLRVVVSSPGQGYGRILLQSLKKYAFIDHQYDRFWLDVAEENIRALTLYQSEGLVLEDAMNAANKAANVQPYYAILSIYRADYLN